MAPQSPCRRRSPESWRIGTSAGQFPGAEVRTSAGAVAVTNSDGRFRIAAPSGRIQVTVRALGYEDTTLTLEGGGGLARIDLPRAPVALDEIVVAPGQIGVLDVSPAVTGASVTREDIEAIPQFGDDVFRTLKRMPGVASDDISTKLNVRGGTDRDLLVRLDGLELYEPYHLKDLDGALGIVDVQALGRVDLVTGGFPAEYGDKSAGVFEMYSRRPPAEGTRTTLGMSLSSLSAISQGSFGDGRGQWLTSLRRGFLEYVLAMTDVDDDLKPTYWDALGRAQYLVHPDHLLSLEVLYGGDEINWLDDGTGSRVTSSWTNGYLWSGWEASLGSRVRVETLLSLGRLTKDRLGRTENPGGGAFSPLSADVDDVVSVDFAGIKQDWQIDVSSDLMVKAGIDVRTSAAEYDYFSRTSRFDLTDQNQLFVRTDSSMVSVAPEGEEVGGYMALRGRSGSFLTWEAGLRYDWQDHTGDEDVAPRLLVRLDLDGSTNLRASWGRYFQSQGIHELNVQDGERTFAGAQLAEQVAVGLERHFGNGFSARVEGYHRSITDPHPLFVNLSREVNPIMEVEGDRRRLDPSESRAKGLELILARDGQGPFSWSASYALARSEDRIEGDWVPRTLDQRHTLNLRGAWSLGPDWQISSSWSYHTGWPFTEQFLDLELGLSEDGTEEINVIRRGFGAINAGRLPSYHRLDLRFTRAFTLDRSRLEVFLDVFNAYNRTNLRGYEWYLRPTGNGYRAARDSGEEQLPILPTLGFRWVF